MREREYVCKVLIGGALCDFVVLARNPHHARQIAEAVYGPVRGTPVESR